MKSVLVVSFPDQSESFCNGVEFGRLLQKMEQGDDHVENNGFPIREENVEVLKSTCAYFGYTAIFGQPCDGWIEFIGIKKTMSQN